MDMSVNIAGVEWKNPVTVASGTFGSGEEFSEYVDLNRLGAVTTKGVERQSYPARGRSLRWYDECDWFAEPWN